MTDSSLSQGRLLQNCQAGKRFWTKLISTVPPHSYLSSPSLLFYGHKPFKVWICCGSWISLSYMSSSSHRKHSLTHTFKPLFQYLPQPFPNPISPLCVYHKSIKQYQLVDKSKSRLVWLHHPLYRIKIFPIALSRFSQFDEMYSEAPLNKRLEIIAHDFQPFKYFSLSHGWENTW